MTEKELSQNEEKKMYLKRYSRAVRRERDILEEIQQLRESKMFPCVVNDGMPHATDCKDLSDYAAKLDGEIAKLKKQRLENIRIYSDIKRKIDVMENDDQKDVLNYRYIHCLKWEEICLKMRWSWSHTHRIHALALKNFKME